MSYVLYFLLFGAAPESIRVYGAHWARTSIHFQETVIEAG